MEWGADDREAFSNVFFFVFFLGGGGEGERGLWGEIGTGMRTIYIRGSTHLFIHSIILL